MSLFNIANEEAILATAERLLRLGLLKQSVKGAAA